MPTNQSVTLVKGTVPDGTCFGSVSELYDTFVDLTTAYVNGAYSLFNYGDTEPSAADRDKPWIRTDGGYPDRLYVFYDGYWIAKHPVPAGGNERRIWTGTTADLLSYEAPGNSSSTATSYTGPFWEVDTALSAKFLVGAGTFAGGTVVNVNGTGGSDEITLTSGQLPDHQHKGKAYYKASGGTAGSDASGLTDDLAHENSGHTTSTGYTNSIAAAGVLTTETVGGDNDPITNLPPYYGVYFIKRTARIYYTP